MISFFFVEVEWFVDTGCNKFENFMQWSVFEHHRSIVFECGHGVTFTYVPWRGCQFWKISVMKCFWTFFVDRIWKWSVEEYFWTELNKVDCFLNMIGGLYLLMCGGWFLDIKVEYTWRRRIIPSYIRCRII